MIKSEGETGGDEVIQKDQIIKIEILVAVPATATRRQILEWAIYELEKRSISLDNPLSRHELESVIEPILTDTGTRLRVEESPCPERDGVIIRRRWQEKV